MATELSAAQKQALLELARASIAHGLDHGTPLPVDPEAYDGRLREAGAAFVTLHLSGRLRGCIGSLEARRPLVVDVAHNAFAAAFSDPRFPPLTRPELERVEIEISILNPAEPIEAESEEALLEQLRPGTDGLILEEGPYRATFLPTVWESLPDPRDFLAQLKLKAGLPPHHWSPTLRFWRYTTTTFSE